MILRLAAILILACCNVYGQSPRGQITSPATVDSLTARSLSELDSIRNSAADRFASIRVTYDSVIMAVDKQATRINQQIDSLENLNLPGDGLLSKLDSIELWKDKRINALNEKIENLKSRGIEKISTLNLPPGLEDKGRELTLLMSKLDVSSPDSEIPFTIKDDLQMDLPGLENPLGDQGIPGIDNISLSETGLGEAGEQINQYQDQLSTIPANMEEASSLAEEQAMKISEVTEISEQLIEVGEVTEMAGSLPDQQAVKEELTRKAQQQAIDHFQGKEEQLQKAMETLAKYKQKYSKLEGLDQIPKKKSNEMRGKPLVERVVPGIALQIHRKDAWMVDFNVYAGYRFNPRLIVGAGWNQRVAYDADEPQFEPDLRIFGPRLFGEFAVGQGFSGRLESEYMNTRVPPQFASGNADADGREWVFSTVAGIKKEYRFLRKVKGTMMLLYNLHDPNHRSPYADKLMVRFGFEFEMKKKPKRP